VAADLAVHGASVQTRAAADALEKLAGLFPQDLGASVVDEDDVDFPGPSGSGLRRGPVVMLV
jgi:hypothetical protein